MVVAKKAPAVVTSLRVSWQNEPNLVFPVPFQMLLWNGIGGVCIIAWNFSITLLVCLVLKRFNLFRVPESAELRGLDFAHYSNEPAYPGEPMTLCRLVFLENIL